MHKYIHKLACGWERNWCNIVFGEQFHGSCSKCNEYSLGCNNSLLRIHSFPYIQAKMFKRVCLAHIYAWAFYRQYILKSLQKRLTANLAKDVESRAGKGNISFFIYTLIECVISFECVPYVCISPIIKDRQQLRCGQINMQRGGLDGLLAFGKCEGSKFQVETHFGGELRPASGSLPSGLGSPVPRAAAPKIGSLSNQCNFIP